MNGTCHCGAVTWTLQNRPERIVECNCSICRKLGTLWAHAPVGEVAVTGDTLAYIRADCDGDLSFHSCKTCGATTHWAPTADTGPHMAVNLRLAEPAELKGIPHRHFDGADTWEFLD